MTDSNKIQPDPNETGNALQSWSAKRVANAYERYFEANKLMFSISSAFLVTIVALLRIKPVLKTNENDVWLSIFFNLVCIAIVLLNTVFLYFEIEPEDCLKEKFKSQQLTYHVMSFFWFLSWIFATLFATNAFMIH